LFIELTEILRCPNDHAESYVVAAPIAMDGRRIVRGVIGCPECKAEFPIVDGVAYFVEAGGGQRGGAGGRQHRGEHSGGPAARAPLPGYDAAALVAFLNLDGPGGYAALVGTAARCGPEVAGLLPGVHIVAVNPPAGVAPLPSLSLLVSPRGLPFKSATLRAVALGADCAAIPWLADAARVLLPGLRLVIEDERASPEGVSELARGAGMFVGMKDR
jgi:uncharacterized protein YbaR (Trm112 family)